MTKAERLQYIDEQFAYHVSAFCYEGGRTRADVVAMDDGTISFADWVRRALRKRDEAVAKVEAMLDA